MFKNFDIQKFGSDTLWNRIAIISGVFALLVSLLIIANYVQFKKADPMNMRVINSLVERLAQNPSDSALRDEIRSLDLLSRKAYFTNKWQIRMGGYLILFSIALMVFALQLMSYRRKIVPQIPIENVDNVMRFQHKTRKWIVTGGIVILATALLFAFLTTNELEKSLSADKPTRNDSTALSSNGDISNTNTITKITDSVKAAITDSTSNTEELKPKKTVSTDNYPTFRGNGGTGIAYKKNIPINWDGKSGNNILWKTSIPLPGFNSPVIWGDVVFLTGATASKREVYGIDRVTGKFLWTTAVENIPGSPDQAPKPNAETGFAAPTSAVDANAVYSIFANGDIIALDHDGKKIWAQNLGLPGNHYGYSSSLMIYGELLFVQYDQKTAPKLLALSNKTGKIVWSTNRAVKISWASPVLINTGQRAELILVAEPFVASYNPNNGQELWKIDCIAGEVGPSVAYTNGIVFSVNDYSKLAAIKIGEQPTILWENTDYLSDIPSPVANDKYLFLVTSYGTTVCYDVATGQKYWEHEFGNNVYASPIIVEGKVYLLDRTGVMHIFKADKEFIQLATPSLGEKSACTPAFTNGHVYIRSDKNLFCIGK